MLQSLLIFWNSAVGRAHEVGLAAGARIGFDALQFRAALAQKVNLHGGVDGNELVVLPGQVGVVGEVHGVHFHGGVAVHKLVELFAAQAEGGDHLAGQVVLAAVGDDAP